MTDLPHPANQMREAALLMRERAKAVSSGLRQPPPDGSGVEQAETAYNASMHPQVAFAVADWLDFTAKMVDDNRLWDDDALARFALKTARVYLGRRRSLSRSALRSELRTHDRISSGRARRPDVDESLHRPRGVV